MFSITVRKRDFHPGTIDVVDATPKGLKSNQENINWRVIAQAARFGNICGRDRHPSLEILHSVINVKRVLLITHL